MAEVDRISSATSAAEVLNIPKEADEAALQRAWKALIFLLHPDKLSQLPPAEQAAATEAWHAVHQARQEFQESMQASGEVEVPTTPVALGRPLCTGTHRGQRRYECRWSIPEVRDSRSPVEKYEVYGPRIFAHTGEPMEWTLLATLPRREGCFVFVEESPMQQEVMWAGDRARAPAVPLTVYAANGRGKSEALYFQLPWAGKFPWLSQGLASVLCRHCCLVQPRAGGEGKQQCGCGAWISPGASAVVLRCPKCHGEALWDGAGSRLDCRACGRHMADGKGQRGASMFAGRRTGHSVGPSRR